MRIAPLKYCRICDECKERFKLNTGYYPPRFFDEVMYRDDGMVIFHHHSLPDYHAAVATWRSNRFCKCEWVEER